MIGKNDVIIYILLISLEYRRSCGTWQSIFDNVWKLLLCMATNTIGFLNVQFNNEHVMELFCYKNNRAKGVCAKLFMIFNCEPYKKGKVTLCVIRSLLWICYISIRFSIQVTSSIPLISSMSRLFILHLQLLRHDIIHIYFIRYLDQCSLCSAFLQYINRVWKIIYLICRYTIKYSYPY